MHKTRGSGRRDKHKEEGTVAHDASGTQSAREVEHRSAYHIRGVA